MGWSWTFHAGWFMRICASCETAVVVLIHSLLPVDSSFLLTFFWFPLHSVPSDGSGDKGEPSKEWEDNRPRSYTHRQTVRRWTWHPTVESPEKKKKKQPRERICPPPSSFFPSFPFFSSFGSEFYKTYIRETHMNISKNLEGYGVILYLTELLLDHFHSPGFLVLDLNRC